MTENDELAHKYSAHLNLSIPAEYQAVLSKARRKSLGVWEARQKSRKRRAPCQIQGPQKIGPVKWRVKCQCGKILYTLRREVG
jgi:hypothetical protein